MLPPAFQSPKAAVSAVAFGSVSVYCFFKLYYDHLSPVGSGDEIPALCGSESNWDASLGNDCFRTGAAFTQQSAAGDKRITAITEVIHGIKAIKLFGWESRFIAKVDERREQQLSYMWKKFLWSTILGSTTQIANQEEIMRFSLKDVDVRFPLGQLSIVAGPTGSGKSSLLSALIGEMTLVRGRVLLPTISPSALAETLPNYRDIIKLSREGATIHDIVYVAQEAWLRNATIRENILFGEPYDLERYEEVLRICALKPDLRILVAGDMSEAGERGIALSGGQKQRVALARAVYSSRRILLIDDCLSAVDAHTSKHILVECLSGNSRIMQGRTRVLVTHHVAMCLPYAQYMVMVNGGRIALKGTPAELRNSNSLSSALIESLDNKNNESAMKQNNKENTTSVNDRRPEDEYNKEHLQKLAAKRGIDPNADLSMLQGVLIKDEEREIGYVKFEVWKMFMKTCDMHKLLIRKIVHAVPKFHDTTTAGRIINRFSRDMSVIDDGALDSIGSWFGRIISVLAI
ncbi:hypothetical protein IWW48_002000 [Coemansia sp. RSA 1200]|nr:hypothetical protein IWW48_002000 [Coemansia sp. RSA 1200]